MGEGPGSGREKLGWSQGGGGAGAGRGGDVPDPPVGFLGERRRHMGAPRQAPPAPQSGSARSGDRRTRRSRWDSLWTGGGLRTGPGSSPRPARTGAPRPERHLTNGHMVGLLLAGEGQQHFIGGRLSCVKARLWVLPSLQQQLHQGLIPGAGGQVRLSGELSVGWAEAWADADAGGGGWLWQAGGEGSQPSHLRFSRILLASSCCMTVSRISRSRSWETLGAGTLAPLGMAKWPRMIPSPKRAAAPTTPPSTFTHCILQCLGKMGSLFIDGCRSS